MSYFEVATARNRFFSAYFGFKYKSALENCKFSVNPKNTMIKFFRRLRMQLLPENKFGKYFLYAIGEIVLVVIGILIALSINNWNNNKIETKKEQVILKGLKTTFESNLQVLIKINTSTKVVYEASLELMEYVNPEIIEYSVSDIDSLISLMINYSSYDPSIGTIENIINSGELNLIKNEKLQNNISNWSGMLHDTNKDIEILNEHTFNALMGFIMKNANLKNTPVPSKLLNTTQFISKKPSNFTPDYHNLLTSLEFENLIDFHSLNVIYLYNEYVQLQSYLEATIEMLEKEIR